MGLLKEFKDFALRGNVVDMAVGLIMGAAFTSIVTSLNTNVIMPPIGYVIGGVSFTDLKFTLPEVKIPSPDPTDPTKMITTTLKPVEILYGKFLQACFDFLIIAICVFGLVKLMNTLFKKKAEAPSPPDPTPTEKLLTEIRDSLKARG